MATYTAASVALADVQAAVNLAVNGDTVFIPAGTASWTTYLDITHAITLQGQTTVTGTNPVDFVADDQTIIIDDSDRGAGGTLIAVHGAAGGVAGLTSGAFRMTGITFRYSVSTTGVTNFGSTKLVAYPPATCRIDHCHYDGLHSESYISTSSGNVIGVFDHNIFTFTHHSAGFEIFNPNYGGLNYGDAAWSDDTGFGTSNFVFIETNLINNPGDTSENNAQTVGCVDCFYGGRYVYRYNYTYNSVATNHGSETPGRARSARAMEVYANTFNFNQSWAGSAGISRGGVLLDYDNSYIGNTSGGRPLVCFRSFAPYVFPAANGNFGFDLNSNTADHTGNGYGGGANGLYASGTAASGTNNHVLTVAGTPWTTNQWVGYMISNTDLHDTGGNGVRADFIIANTANTITTSQLTPDPGFDPLGNIYWSTGNHYQIYAAPTYCFDQNGRGKGDLMSGDPGPGSSWPGTIVNSATGLITTLHQALEPCYSWGNTVNGSPTDAWFSSQATVSPDSNYPTIVENRDFYNATAMPGYSPYTYPHPLTGSLAAPVNVSAPTVGGAHQVGQAMTFTRGAWTGNPSPTLTSVLRKCDGSGNTCSDLSGQTGLSYTPVTGDAGATIRIRVTATNSQGSSTVDSAQSSPITAADTGLGTTILGCPLS